MSAEKTGLNRLVSGLASRQDHQVLPADGLTGLGKALRSDRQVSIEGPEDGDLAGYVTQNSSHTRTHQISPFHLASIHGRGPRVDSRRLSDAS